MAIDPFRANPTRFQKTLAINDFYFQGEGSRFPLGNLQMLGKLQAGMLAASKPYVPKATLREMANRSVDWWVMSEDLPSPESRVILGTGGRIEVVSSKQSCSARSVDPGRDAHVEGSGIPYRFRSTHGHRDELPSMRHGQVWH
jgi:hypothetical protein